MSTILDPVDEVGAEMSVETSPMTNSFIIFLILDLAALVRSSPPEVAGVADKSLESVDLAGLPRDGPEKESKPSM